MTSKRERPSCPEGERTQSEHRSTITRKIDAGPRLDYSVVGVTLQIVAERLCEALEIVSGKTFLDAAAGSGNLSLAAARRFCDVTAVEAAPALVERCQNRAYAEGLLVQCKVARPEKLPFANDSFDYIGSSFGLTFSLDQEAIGLELVRVVRSGGKIGLTNWTPQGFTGQLVKTISDRLGERAAWETLAFWGSSESMKELFVTEAAVIETVRMPFVWRFRSTRHWITLWQEEGGTLHEVFGALDGIGQRGLAAEIVSMIDRYNTETNEGVAVPDVYLETVITLK